MSTYAVIPGKFPNMTPSEKDDAAQNPASQDPQKHRRGKLKSRKRVTKKAQKKVGNRTAGQSDYPRHSLKKALRIPYAILEQNAGRACTDRESAEYCKVGFHGPY